MGEVKVHALRDVDLVDIVNDRRVLLLLRSFGVRRVDASERTRRLLCFDRWARNVA